MKANYRLSSGLGKEGTSGLAVLQVSTLLSHYTFHTCKTDTLFQKPVPHSCCRVNELLVDMIVTEPHSSLHPEAAQTQFGPRSFLSSALALQQVQIQETLRGGGAFPRVKACKGAASAHQSCSTGPPALLFQRNLGLHSQIDEAERVTGPGTPSKPHGQGGCGPGFLCPSSTTLTMTLHQLSAIWLLSGI